MAEVREAVASLVGEKPEAEDALREVLRVDEATTEWGFDDVPVDSGLFGEIVSRGIVEREGDGYRLAGPEEVRSALAGDAGPDAAAGRRSWSTTDLRAEVLDRLPTGTQVAVAAALAGFVVLSRAVYFRTVFRRGDVVLPTNDPYFYRYLVETYVATAGGPADVEAGSPLLVVTMGELSKLAGGTAHATGVVLAWYPVVACLLVVGLVYVATVRLSGSRTLGVVVAVMLASTSGFALRTALGYADHHAFDYVWLALTMTAVVTLRSDRRLPGRYERWSYALVLGLGVGAQLLSWRGGVLLVGPLAGVVGLLALDDLRRNRSPVRSNVPVLAGMVVGLGIVLLARAAFGWLTVPLVSAPVVVVAGAVGLVAIAELSHRTRPSVAGVVAVDAVALALGATLFVVVAGEGNVVSRGVDYFSRTLGSGVAETLSLGVFSGPIIYFGFFLFLALPALVYATWRTYRESYPGYLVFVAYAWYFLALAFVQRRFVGELSVPLSLFVGLAFVYLAVRVDIVPAVDLFDPFGPEGLRVDAGVIRSNGAQLLVLFVLFSGLSLVQIPVNIQKVTVDPQQHDAARYVDGFAEERGMTYPENYVLSEWGVNRMYNYYVSHLSVPSLRYSYSRTNFQPFLRSPTPEEWYSEFDGKVGFIVITDDDARERFSEGSAYVRLYDHYGSDHGDVPGLSHYRAIYESDDGSIEVFQVVEGATITGDATEPVTLRTRVQIRGTTVSYERLVRPGAGGTFSVTVPYPGEYEVDGQTVEVPEEAVTNGSTIEL